MFGGSGKDLVKAIDDTIDNISTSDQEKLAAKEKLTNTVMTHLVTVIQSQAGIITAEAQGNWLQRSWRPILMLSFGFIIIYRYFLSQVFDLPSVDLPVDFWELLNLGIGGYVIGRTVEKVSDKAFKNIDISFVKKKNRTV